MYEVDINAEPGNANIVCPELNEGLGGGVLEKSPDNLRQDLSDIAAAVAETGRKNDEVRAKLLLENSQRRLKLQQELDRVSAQYQSTIE